MDYRADAMIAQNKLRHFGILGMKWGVRRYQNEDGSLTDAGRKRYGVGDPSKLVSKENRAVNDNRSKIDELIEKTEIKKNSSDPSYPYIEANYNHDGKVTNIWGFSDDGKDAFHTINEKTLKQAAKAYFENEAEIKKLSLEAIGDDESFNKYWLTDEFWEITEFASKEEVLDNLDINVVYVTGNNMIEVSVTEKRGCPEDILAGHELNMEFDLNHIKKPSWVGCNG